MSYPSVSLPGLRHPLSAAILKRRGKEEGANFVHGSGSCTTGGSTYPVLPLPPSRSCLILRQGSDRATGPVTQAPREGGNGVGRREAIGLGACLNAFLFFHAPVGEQEGGAAAAAIEEGQCSLTVTPSGLAFCDRLVGYGAVATKGQLIKAHYVGKLEDGNVFDSSYSRGRPLTFRVGVGEVIKGWDQGILGGEGIPPMLSGGKRTLRIPPELAYGMRGAGCKGGSCIIPPDSTLFFDVEFIGKA